ncbi:MAG: L-galactose dehydrogenase [Cellvibrionaceae bacterium]
MSKKGFAAVYQFLNKSKSDSRVKFLWNNIMMKVNTLGKTGLRVSKIGFGCAPLGNGYGEVSAAEGTRAVHHAIDAGVNFFDTSTYYGETLSENRLGEALKGKREKVVLATKGGRFGLELETGFDFTYDNIIRMCEASLKRLQTDWLDVYQLHDIEFGRPEVVLEGIRALYDLKKQGKVRFIGVTGFPVELLRDMVTAHDFDVTLSYCHGNLLNQRMNEVLVPAVKSKRMGLINASVTHMGILTHQGEQDWHPASAAVKAAGRRAAEFCAAQGVSLPELAIQFALQNPHADITLLGTRTTAELESSLALVDRPIDKALLAKVQEIIAPVKDMSWPSGYWDAE